MSPFSASSDARWASRGLARRVPLPGEHALLGPALHRRVDEPTNDLDDAHHPLVLVGEDVAVHHDRTVEGPGLEPDRGVRPGSLLEPDLRHVMPVAHLVVPVENGPTARMGPQTAHPDRTGGKLVRARPSR